MGETETVYYNIAIDKSASEIVKGFIEELGGQIAEEKQLKFEDLGLAEIEGQRGHYQCLVCSSTFNRKGSAVFHFKKFHQLLKRSFQPSASRNAPSSSQNIPTKIAKVEEQLDPLDMVPKEANVKFEEQLDLLDLVPNDENNTVKFEELPDPFGL